MKKTSKSNVKRIISIVLAIACLSALCINLIGCKEEKSESTKKSISEEKAISIAKESEHVQNKIADAYGIKFYMTPSWGTCTATLAEDGDWEVTLKGKIMGYTDDYKENMVYDKIFTATVSVSSSGYVGYVSVKKG